MKVVTRQLPVTVSGLELQKFSDELAAKGIRREELEAAKKDKAAEFKELIEDCASRMRHLQQVVNSREEVRSVECQWVEAQDLTMDLIRLDTGVIVESRPMTEQERYVPMYPDADEDEEAADDADEATH